VWRVRDENSIKIWGDKWLLTPMSYFVQSSIRLIDKEAKVNEFIEVDTKWQKFP
jgi:hypothetical protein